MIKGSKKITYRRKKKNSFLKKRWFWDLILILIFLGSLSWLLFKTPYFEIEEIEISADPRFKEKIKELSSKETNFFLFSSEKISHEAKKHFPEIKELKIIKKFPNKIFIEVKERKEIGLFCMEGKVLDCFLLSSDAVVFSKAEPSEELITFLKPEDKALPGFGEKIIKQEKFSEILFFLKEISGIDILVQRVEIFPFEVRIITKNNFKIYLSQDANIKNQAVSFINIYQNTISEEEKHILEYIDLRRLEGGERGQVYWK